MDYRNGYEHRSISKSGEEEEERWKRKAMCSQGSEITQTMDSWGLLIGTQMETLWKHGGNNTRCKTVITSGEMRLRVCRWVLLSNPTIATFKTPGKCVKRCRILSSEVPAPSPFLLSPGCSEHLLQGVCEVLFPRCGEEVSASTQSFGSPLLHTQAPFQLLNVNSNTDRGPCWAPFRLGRYSSVLCFD